MFLRWILVVGQLHVKQTRNGQRRQFNRRLQSAFWCDPTDCWATRPPRKRVTSHRVSQMNNEVDIRSLRRIRAAKMQPKVAGSKIDFEAELASVQGGRGSGEFSPTD